MQSRVAAAIAGILTAIAVAAPSPQDEAFLASSVRDIAAIVEREYFDPDLARAAADALRSRLSEGRYARLDLRALAAEVSRDLVAVTRDKHLSVAVLPEDAGAPPAGGDDDRQVRGRRENFGVQRVEVLAGNVGYLDLRSFYRPEEAHDAIQAAMSLLQHADALILDMRNNSGGSPDTVALLASYLFDEADLPLFSIIPRQQSEIRRYATAVTAAPERNGRRPTYVLTSKTTFSAGEGMPFILQERKRAEVIGERTAGAANPGRQYPVNARLAVTVPNGRVTSAVSKANWEGTGVRPNVEAPASDALRVAHMRALEQLLTMHQSGPWHETLKRHLAALKDGR
jgi:hypothetical protein